VGALSCVRHEAADLDSNGRSDVGVGAHQTQKSRDAHAGGGGRAGV